MDFIMKNLFQLVAEHFKIPLQTVSDAMTSHDVPDWDSLNYLLFVAELEKEYNISFTMDEVLGIQKVGDIRTILKNKGISV